MELDPGPLRTLALAGLWTTLDPGPVRTMDQSEPWPWLDPGPLWTQGGARSDGKVGGSENAKGPSPLGTFFKNFVNNITL